MKKYEGMTAEEEAHELVDEIVKELVKVRKSQGITQHDIAEATGMKTPNVTRVESCKYVSTLGVLVRYAHALGKEIHFEIVDSE